MKPSTLRTASLAPPRVDGAPLAAPYLLELLTSRYAGAFLRVDDLPDGAQTGPSQFVLRRGHDATQTLALGLVGSAVSLTGREEIWDCDVLFVPQQKLATDAYAGQGAELIASAAFSDLDRIPTTRIFRQAPGPNGLTGAEAAASGRVFVRPTTATGGRERTMVAGFLSGTLGDLGARDAQVWTGQVLLVPRRVFAGEAFADDTLQAALLRPELGAPERFGTPVDVKPR